MILQHRVAQHSRGVSFRLGLADILHDPSVGYTAVQLHKFVQSKTQYNIRIGVTTYRENKKIFVAPPVNQNIY